MSDDATVACPVEGCALRDTAPLVAAHGNGSEDASHDWDALRFGGPRDLLQQVRAGWLDGGESADDAWSPERAAATGETDTDDSRPAGDTVETTGSSAGPIPVGEVRRPADGCHYTDELASVKARISGTRDRAHDPDGLRERGRSPDEDDVKGATGSGDSADETATAASIDTPAPATTSTTSPATRSAGEGSSESGAGPGIDESGVPTADGRVTGDTTLAELLDLLDSVESQDTMPFDPATVGTALVCCDLLAEVADDPDARTLVDACTLASDLPPEAGDARTALRDELLAGTDADGEPAGGVGRGRRVTHTCRTLKHDEEVLAGLREAGIGPDSVLRPDSTRVRETLDAANLPESLAFEVSESRYVRKADGDADAKRARLAGLRRRGGK
jgi:hypothetical protein